MRLEDFDIQQGTIQFFDTPAKKSTIYYQGVKHFWKDSWIAHNGGDAKDYVCCLEPTHEQILEVLNAMEMLVSIQIQQAEIPKQVEKP